MRPSVGMGLLLVMSLGLAACGPSRAASPTIQTTETVPPLASPAPSLPPEPSATPAPSSSFEAATYTDAAAGFEFDYPSSWTVEAPAGGGSRGSYATLTSWSHPPGGITEVPPDGTILQATVQLWDPKNDLKGFLAHQEEAWSGSGNIIVSQEPRTLPDGQAAASFVVQGSDGAQGYFFITTLDDAYLVLSGNGDLALLDEIAGTLRRVTPAEY